VPTITRARLRRMTRRETVGVDVLAALNLVGALVRYLAVAFVFPAGLAIAYDEPPWPFVWAGLATAGAGFALTFATRGKERVGPREGFLVVALTWLAVAAAGALPYLFSDEEQLSSPLDAYFEAMSGFTTTGASVLVDIEALDRSLLMWRQFSQWLGGMGIIVLALAVLPRLRVGGRQLFETEAPGPEIEPLAASIRDTARRLWALYVALTVVCAGTFAVLGWTGVDTEMDLFDAVAHAFSTLPTGGFSPHADSMAGFAPATQWADVIFMLLAGANFALLYVAFVRGRPRVLVRDEELRMYVVVAAAVSIVLTLTLIGDDVFAGEEAVRQAVFQVVSMMTTTGFASADFATWPALAAMLLVGVMFIGGSAGSTSGSIKVVRHVLIGRILRRELDQTVHPEVVVPLRLNRRTVDEKNVRAVIAFVLLYVGLFVAGATLIAIDSSLVGVEVGAFDAIAASATTLGNVGPGFGFAGPYGSFADFSGFSKSVMIVLMWLGRLELIPVLVLFTRQYWRA
jgi:trk system potassium uptake protein TrkH